MTRHNALARLLAPLLAAIALAAAAPAQSLFDKRVDAVRAQIVGNPASALATIEHLRSEVPPEPPAVRIVSLAKVDWLKSEALIRADRAAEALVVSRAALNAVARVAPDSKLHGDLLIAHGGAASTAGDVQTALGDYQRAYMIYGRAGEPRGQAIALQDIGTIYRDAGDHATALRYNSQAIELYASDPSLLLTAYNNRGNALTELHRYSEAETAYRRALAVARRQDSPLLVVRILQNLARAQVWAHDLAAAEQTLASAYPIAAGGPAMAWRPALDGVAAMIALRRNQLSQAAMLIDRTFANADNIPATMPLKDFHRTAYEIFKARGNDAKALAHLEAFKQLDDEGRALAASTNAALMRARFDFANQDLKIARTQARLRITIVAGLFAAAAVISTLLAIGFFSIRRSRNEVRAVNQTLTATNAELAKALAAKSEFLATTSHEIRTPLNGILGMTQVMLTDRALSASLRSRIELVHGAGETMRALVDDILDVAKMETGELKIHPEPMNLRRLLEETAAVWSGQAETKRVAIALDIAEAPETIVADEVRLRQIVFNLMSNAIKFTDRGEVRLSCHAHAVDQGGEHLVIAVRDSGVGIPADRLEDIFESFRQVDGGKARRHGGTGLGLTICRNIARAMGGDIRVSSEVGTGSTFSADLPLVRAASVAEAPAHPAAAPSTFEAADLLLVESNPLSQGILRALLTPHVAQVQVAGDAPEALAALEGPVTHILADAGTLGLDLATAEQLAIAAAAAGKRLTILWPSPDAATAETLDPWGVQLIAKPISPPDLLAALRMVYLPPAAPRDEAA